MNRTRALFSRWGLTLTKTAVFLAVAFAGGMVASLLRSSSAQATPSGTSPFFAVGQLGRVLVQIENAYVDPVDRERLVTGAIKGMVEELDPHSSYLPAQDFSLFQADTEGQFGGVGIEVDTRDDTLMVIAPIEGSPAARAGIRSGDRIIAIDGEMIQVSALSKLVRRMRGKPGTHVRLSVKREGQKDLLTFDLVRQIVHVPSVASKLLEGGIGYVKVRQFQEHTHDELVHAAATLREQGKGKFSAVILDLRNNPGGLVDEAVEVADEFLSGGLIYSSRHRGKVVDEAYAKPGGVFADLPTVTLVNEWSASASELVAGALQDLSRTVLIGANTFGKGSVQSILELPNGAGLRLTTARYYTPKGHAIQAEGVHPDVLLQSGAVEANGQPVLRERDLEGHLPSETGNENLAVGIAQANLPDGGREPGIEGSRAYDVPSDPAKGKDLALRLGYQLLRSSLVGRGPYVR